MFSYSFFEFLQLFKIEAGLSNIVGNLSSRMVVQQARVMESSVSVLNIDQSVVTARDFKQARGKGVRAHFPSDRQLRYATSSHNSF